MDDLRCKPSTSPTDHYPILFTEESVLVSEISVVTSAAAMVSMDGKSGSTPAILG